MFRASSTIPALLAAAAIAATLMAAPASAAFPFPLWSQDPPAGAGTGPAFVLGVASQELIVSVVAVSSSGTYEATAHSAVTGEQRWATPVCPDSGSTIAGVAAHPNADAADAVVVVSCHRSLAAFFPQNGSLAWTLPINPSSGKALELIAPPGIFLPTVLSPAGGSPGATASSRFVVPLYPSQKDGASGLVLLGVVDPEQRRVLSAELPCFGPIPGVYDSGVVDVVIAQCESSVVALSIADGRTSEIWRFDAPAGYSLHTTAAGFASSSSSADSFIYANAHKPNEAQQFWRIHTATGNVTRLNVTGDVPTTRYSYQGLKLSGSDDGASLVVYNNYQQNIAIVYFATVAAGSSTLNFTDLSAMFQQDINIFGVAAIPFEGAAKHFAVITQTQVNEEVYLGVLDAANGTMLYSASVETNDPEAQGGGLQVAFCRRSLRVVLGGGTQAVGYVASATPSTAPYQLMFAAGTTVMPSSVALVGGTAAVGFLSNSGSFASSAFGFSSAPNAAWTRFPQGKRYAGQTALAGGVSYGTGLNSVVAFGPQGRQLWQSPRVFAGASAPLGLHVVGETVVVRMLSSVVAVNVNNGSFLYEHALGTVYGACDQPTAAMSEYLVKGVAIGDTAVLLPYQSTSNNLRPTCSYLVRADGLVIPLALSLTAQSQIVVAPNSTSIVVNTPQSVVEIDAWTGAVVWSQQSVPVATTAAAKLFVSPSLVFFAGDTTTQCMVRARKGAVLWSHSNFVGLHGATGDNVVATTKDSVTGSVYLASFRTEAYANGTGAVVADWLSPFPNVGQYGAAHIAVCLRGLIVSYTPTGASGAVLAAYRADTGAPAWSSTLDVFCSAIQVVDTESSQFVVLSCGSTIYVDPIDGTQLLSFSGFEATTLNANVLINTDAYNGIYGRMIPSRVLVAMLANASIAFPLPPPFVPPPPPPGPSTTAVPTPQPIPPLPTVIPPPPGLNVRWTYGTSGIVASAIPVNGVLLAAGQSALIPIDVRTGTVLNAYSPPTSCQDFYPGAMTSTATQFIITCSNGVVGMLPNGVTQWAFPLPDGLVDQRQLAQPLSNGDVAILYGQSAGTYTGATFVKPSGAQHRVMLPSMSLNWVNLPTSRTDGHGVLFYSLNTALLLNTNGLIQWNVSFNVTLYENIVDGVLTDAEGAAVIMIQPFSTPMSMARILPNGTATWVAPVLNVIPPGEDPLGALSTGVTRDGPVAVWSSSFAKAIAAVDVTTGALKWNISTAGAVLLPSNVALTRSCAVFAGKTSSGDGFVSCLDPANGQDRFNATFGGASVPSPSELSASEDPASGDIVFVFGRSAARLKSDGSGLEWLYERPVTTEGINAFKPTTVIGLGTPSAYIVAASESNGDAVAVIDVAAPSNARMYFPSDDERATVAPFVVVPHRNASGSVSDDVSLVITSNYLLYRADAQTGVVGWRAGLPGVGGAKLIMGYGASAIVRAEGGEVAVARSTGVFFFNESSGRATRSVLYSSLEPTCGKVSETGSVGLWAFGAVTLGIRGGTCAFIVKAAAARSDPEASQVLARLMPQTIVGDPMWSAGRIVFLLSSGAEWALNPMDATVAWTAGAVPTKYDYHGNTFTASSGGGSIVVARGATGVVQARYGGTGQLLWQATFGSLEIGTYVPVDPMRVLREDLLVVVIDGGLVAINISVGATSSRELWSGSFSLDQKNNGMNTYAPQYADVNGGIVVGFGWGSLAAFDAHSGIRLWQHLPSDACDFFQVTGRFVSISTGGRIRTFDIASGTEFMQPSAPGHVHDIVSLPPAPQDGRPRIAFTAELSSGYAVVVSNIDGATQPALPPLPTIPRNVTFPPGVLTTTPAPSQSPPGYEYRETTKPGFVDWGWPSVGPTAQNDDLFTVKLQNDRHLLLIINEEIMAYDVRARRQLWSVHAPLALREASCESRGQALTVDFGTTFLLSCWNNTFYIDAATGAMGNGPSPLPQVDYASGMILGFGLGVNVPTFTDRAVVAFGLTNLFSTGIVSSGGVIGAGADKTFWTVMCNTSVSQYEPTVRTYGTDGTVVVLCSTGETMWINGETGAVIGRVAAPTVPAAQTSITDDGRYIALHEISSHIFVELTILDSKTMSIAKIYSLGGNLPPNSITLTYGVNSTVLALVTQSLLNMRGWTVPIAPEGGIGNTTLEPTWEIAAPGSPMASWTFGNVTVAVGPSTTTFMSTFTGTTVATPSTAAVPNAQYTRAFAAGNTITLSDQQNTFIFDRRDASVIFTSNPLYYAPTIPNHDDSGNDCLLVSQVQSQMFPYGFGCIPLTPNRNWRRIVEIGPMQTTAVGLTPNGEQVLATSGADLTSLSAANGSVTYSFGLPGNVGAGGAVTVGDAVVVFSTTASVWVMSAQTGAQLRELTLPNCGKLSGAASAYTVVVGDGLVYAAGVYGCVYAINVTDAGNADVTCVVDQLIPGDVSTPRSQPLFVGDASTVYWLDGPDGQLTAIETRNGTVKWQAPVPPANAYASVVEYGVFVFAVSGRHSVNVHTVGDGSIAAVIPVTNGTLFGTMLAFNDRLWLPTLSGAVSLSSDPGKALRGDVRYVDAFATEALPPATPAPTSVESATRDRGVIRVDAKTGIVVFAAQFHCAAIDTQTSAVLWTTTFKLPPGGSGVPRTTFTIVNDAVVGEFADFTVSVFDLRGGALQRQWIVPNGGATAELVTLGPIFVSARLNKAFFGTYRLGNLLGVALGPSTLPDPALTPIPTGTAPVNSNVQTLPPPPPIETLGPDSVSLGCVRRIVNQAATLQQCVQDSVVTALFARAPGSVNCAAAAAPMTLCVNAYAGTMEQCGAGITYLREFLSSLNASAQPLAVCGESAACDTAAGKAAFCAALQVPRWAPAEVPLPTAAGIPPIPSITTTLAPATTTAATVIPATTTTTAMPTTTTTTAAPATITSTSTSTSTSAPTSTVVPTLPPSPSSPPTPPPQLSSLLRLQLLSGAKTPTEAGLAAEFQTALGLSSAPALEIFGVQQGARVSAMSASSTGPAVVFAFTGINAESLALRALALPASVLRTALSAASLSRAVPPATPPPTPTSTETMPPTTTATSTTPTTTTTQATTTATAYPTATAMPTTTTSSPSPPPTTTMSGTPAPMSQLLALVLQPGAPVPDQPQLAQELKVAMGLATEPAVAIIGLLRGDTVIFAFMGNGASALASKFLDVPAAKLRSDLKASKAETAAAAENSGGHGGGSSGGSSLPSWVLPVLICVSMCAAALVVLVVVKRRSIFGANALSDETESMAGGDAHSVNTLELNTADRIHSGGGSYSRLSTARDTGAAN